MMRTCDKCGAGDDIGNMSYISENGEVLCLCEGCAKGKNGIPVAKIEKAIKGGRYAEAYQIADLVYHLLCGHDECFDMDFDDENDGVVYLTNRENGREFTIKITKGVN